MTVLERSIVIKGTAAEIDAITSDGDRLPEWYAGITKATADGIFPDPGGIVEMKYKSAGITAGVYEEIFEPVDDGTRFTLKFDYEMPGGGVGKLVDKLFVERMNAKNLEESLENMKTLVEG